MENHKEINDVQFRPDQAIHEAPQVAKIDEAASLAVQGLAKTAGNKNAENRDKSQRLSPTQELYKAIFGSSPDIDIDDADIPELLSLLETTKTREADVVIRHFGLGGQDAETYTDIAGDYGVNGSVTHAVGQKALEKLRQPFRAERIQELFMPRAELRTQIKTLKQQIEALNDQIAGYESRLAQERILHSMSDESSPEAISDEEALKKVRIEDLGFSLRTVNCLKRGGIPTLYGLTVSDLSRVRNLGGMGIAEIEEKLSSIGLSPKDN